MEGHLIVELFADCDGTPDISDGDWMPETVCTAIAYCSARDKDDTEDRQSKSVVQAPESSLMEQLDLERQYRERMLRRRRDSGSCKNSPAGCSSLTREGTSRKGKTKSKTLPRACLAWEIRDAMHVDQHHITVYK